MATTLVAGAVSSNELVQPGFWVVVRPTRGASVLVEYTTGTSQDITSGAATWKEAFTTTNPFLFKNDDDLCNIYVRITATTYGGEYEILGDSLTLDFRLQSRGYETYVINTPYRQVSNTKDKFVLLDDFEGTWAIGDAGPADRWSTTAGSGANTAVATTVAASLNGEVTLKSSTADDTHAANCSTFTSIGLAYKANQGGLAMEARLKIDDVSEAVMFVGFTDTISTTVELPIFLVAADIDSDAANACGVGYDVDGTTKQFFHGGVKANTDTVPVYSGDAPADGVYFNVRVEVSEAGAVQGFINGRKIGPPVADAVTASTALTPMIVIGNRSANQVIATIDYIKVEQDR